MKRHLEAVSRGIVLRLPSGGEVLVKPNIVLLEPEAPRIKCFDAIFIAVKAYGLEQALEEIRGCTCIDTAVVTLQNGWDPHGAALKVYGPRAVHVVTTMGSRRAGGVVELASWGRFFVGSRLGITKFAVTVTRILRDAGLEALIVEDIDAWTWVKLAINAAVNPLTALLRVENGFLKEENANEIAHAVVDEVARVASKCLGIDLPLDPHALLEEVIKSTASNKSSMLQDIEGGRATEVDYINGAIHEIAKACGLDDRVNYVLFKLVKSLERAIKGVRNGSLHSASDLRW